MLGPAVPQAVASLIAPNSTLAESAYADRQCSLRPSHQPQMSFRMVNIKEHPRSAPPEGGAELLIGSITWVPAGHYCPLVQVYAGGRKSGSGHSLPNRASHKS